ncbi:phosphatidylserine/phosphatidylglycerophosphate/cardiolipin synthase family protein [Ectothiorhodospiraceae bacterium 2226]|nr:phosphatidylserine/phosphatidylglycerophosphate/cardiolipin synthase family protein [Ectothiorhodospiraceae bacterium 2226]
MPEPRPRGAQRRRARTELRRLRFAWRGGNHFELLNGGGAFYPRMLGDIAQASRYVLLEMYLVESGAVLQRFLDTLISASERGVQVFMLLDAFGSMGMSRADRLRIEAAGIRLAYYNPLKFAHFRRNLLRNHRKLLLVDGAVAYTGGAGLTDAFAPTDGAAPWHEVMVRTEGPVAADWRHLFGLTWARYAQWPLRLTASAAAPHADGARGRVTFSHRRHNRDLVRALLNQTRTAKERIWIATAYFLPSWKMRRAWRRAARNGVDVRLLLPGPNTDHPPVRYAGQRFYSGLLRAGVRIYEYQPACLHAKIALCDDWCSIGSSNMDRWNTRWNLEANQEVRSAAFAAEIRSWFTESFRVSVEYRDENWRGRSHYERLLQWFWGRMDLWLDRATQARGLLRGRRRRREP